MRCVETDIDKRLGEAIVKHIMDKGYEARLDLFKAALKAQAEYEPRWWEFGMRRSPGSRAVRAGLKRLVDDIRNYMAMRMASDLAMGMGGLDKEQVVVQPTTEVVN